MRKYSDPRDGQRGAVSIILAAMMTTLFGLTALAVDAGFLYTRSRVLQDVADSAVTAGMSDLKGGSIANAENDAKNLVTEFSTANSTVVTTDAATGTSATQLSVHLTWSQPFFFGSIFGFHTKTLNATAVGKIYGATAPAVLALGGCGSGSNIGVTINGEGGLSVTGDIQSDGIVNFQTGPPGVDVSGTVNSPCGAPYPKVNAWDTVVGGTGSSGGFTDPFSPMVIPACDFGTSTSTDASAAIGLNWNTATVPPTLAPGVYCSNTNMNISGPGTGFNLTGVTLISIGGTINVSSGATPSTWTPDPASPNGILAYSSAAKNCSSGYAILIGTETLNLGGSLYAPNGCIQIGSNWPVTIGGSLIGSEVVVGDYGAWTITGATGGGGSGWQMVQ
jgi:hypothetical protein